MMSRHIAGDLPELTIGSSRNLQVLTARSEAIFTPIPERNRVNELGAIRLAPMDILSKAKGHNVHGIQ